MSDKIENKSAIKIQNLVNTNNCINALKNFNNLNLLKISNEVIFEEFNKVILKKEVLSTANELCVSLENYKKGLHLNPKILLSVFLINTYSNELLGTDEIRNEYDNQLTDIVKDLINIFDKNNDIKILWDKLKEYKIIFLRWKDIDKMRAIESIITSYYYRREHLLTFNDKEDTEENYNMKKELENQCSNLINYIKDIDKNFNTDILESNYKEIFNLIQINKENIKKTIITQFKKAYYDMICSELSKGDLSLCHQLLMEIKSRLVIITPSNDIEKFNDLLNPDYLTDILCNYGFIDEVKEIVLFITNLIIKLDAPINDVANLNWKSSIIELMKGNFNKNFPLILIQIEEHIDIIYDLINSL